MLLDLFSSLDYTSRESFESLTSLVWMLGFVWMIVIFGSFFWKVSRVSMFSSFILGLHRKESSPVFKSLKGSYSMIFFVFLFFFGCKLWGLVPYIFGDTTQILFVVVISVLLWSSVVISNLFFLPFPFVGSFFPVCPRFVLPLLSLVEVVSLLMRPLTLSLRLSVNMTTGHVFIVMVSSVLSASFIKGSFFFVVSFFLLVGFFVLELCVCVVQSYVYSLLSASYLEEHST